MQQTGLDCVSLRVCVCVHAQARVAVNSHLYFDTVGLYSCPSVICVARVRKYNLPRPAFSVNLGFCACQFHPLLLCLCLCFSKTAVEDCPAIQPSVYTQIPMYSYLYSCVCMCVNINTKYMHSIQIVIQLAL